MKNRGFSLIELIIVIVIVSVFGAIAVPNFLDTRCAHKARSSFGINYKIALDVCDNCNSCEDMTWERTEAFEKLSNGTATLDDYLSKGNILRLKADGFDLRPYTGGDSCGERVRRLMKRLSILERIIDAQEECQGTGGKCEGCCE